MQLIGRSGHAGNALAYTNHTFFDVAGRSRGPIQSSFCFTGLQVYSNYVLIVQDVIILVAAGLVCEWSFPDVVSTGGKAGSRRRKAVFVCDKRFQDICKVGITGNLEYPVIQLPGAVCRRDSLLNGNSAVLYVGSCSSRSIVGKDGFTPGDRYGDNIGSQSEIVFVAAGLICKRRFPDVVSAGGQILCCCTYAAGVSRNGGQNTGKTAGIRNLEYPTVQFSRSIRGRNDLFDLDCTGRSGIAHGSDRGCCIACNRTASYNSRKRPAGGTVGLLGSGKFPDIVRCTGSQAGKGCDATGIGGRRGKHILIVLGIGLTCIQAKSPSTACAASGNGLGDGQVTCPGIFNSTGFNGKQGLRSAAARHNHKNTRAVGIDVRGVVIHCAAQALGNAVHTVAVELSAGSLIAGRATGIISIVNIGVLHFLVDPFPGDQLDCTVGIRYVGILCVAGIGIHTVHQEQNQLCLQGIGKLIPSCAGAVFTGACSRRVGHTAKRQPVIQANGEVVCSRGSIGIAVIC